jgi:hypothetical protein
LAATRELLERESDESVSIELFSTDNSDPARIERFLLRAKELVPLEEILVQPQIAGDKYRIRILYGTFPDRSAASRAAERLPPKYKNSFQTELRSYGQLRKSP